MLYPYISNWLAERNYSKAIQEYQTGVSETSATALKEERIRAELYNESIIYKNGDISIPSLEETNISSDYFTILKLNTKGIMGYLSIPQINVSLPIYHGIEEEILLKGIGHIATTALPIGGNGNHTVLTGHSGLPSARLFTDLDQLNIGDVFYIHILEDTLTYIVDDISVIEPTDSDFLISDQNQDYVSLVTCTPYGINSHRLVVRGSRIPYIEESEEIFIEPASLSFEIKSWSYITMAIIFTFLIVIINLSTLYVLNNPKRTLILIFTSLLFILGSCLLAYPLISQFRFEKEVVQINAAYMERMKEMESNTHITYTSISDKNAGNTELTDSMADYIYKQMVQYNERLFEECQIGLLDSTSYEEADTELKEFGYYEDMIGYIKIERMNIELPIYLGASQTNMKKGAVHMTNTSLPVGGENTNAVIAAHRGINTLPMFKNIEMLEVGDEIIIVNFYEELIYQVSEINIIDPADKDDILIQPGRDMITLLTCHPYGHNYERYAVYCERK